MVEFFLLGHLTQWIEEHTPFHPSRSKKNTFSIKRCFFKTRPPFIMVSNWKGYNLTYRFPIGSHRLPKTQEEDIVVSFGPWYRKTSDKGTRILTVQKFQTREFSRIIWKKWMHAWIFGIFVAAIGKKWGIKMAHFHPTFFQVGLDFLQCWITYITTPHGFVIPSPTE